MAKLQRSLLIPYLRSLCALELIKNHLTALLQESEAQLQWAQRPKPDLPRPTTYSPAPIYYAAPLALGMGALLFGFLGLHLICWALSVVCGLALVYCHISQCAASKKHSAYFAELLSVMREDIRIWQRDQLHLPQLEQQQARLLEERAQVEALLAQVYAVDVLPTRHRDLYATVYLNDYFSKNNSEDPALALAGYAPEALQARIDLLLPQQRETLIGQFLAAIRQTPLEQLQTRDPLSQAVQAATAQANAYLRETRYPPEER